MTRPTFHCLCGFTSDHPGTCPNESCNGDRLHPKRGYKFKQEWGK